MKRNMRGMAWVAKQNLHLKAPPASSVNDVPKPIHADKLMPEKFARKVRAIFLPRCAAGDSSAVHAGAMTMMKATPQPAQSLATSMWARLTAEDWRMTPSMHRQMATQMPLIPTPACQCRSLMIDAGGVQKTHVHVCRKNDQPRRPREASLRSM